MVIREHSFEIILVVIGLGISIAAWIFESGSAVEILAGLQLTALSFAVWRIRSSNQETLEAANRTLKEEHQRLEEVIIERESSKGAVQGIYDVLATQSGDSLEVAWRRINDCIVDLEKIDKGIVPLDEAEYYKEIISRMSSLIEGERAVAVNSIDERRWSEDPRQVNYAAANRAALGQGAEVERLFIIDQAILPEQEVDLPGILDELSSMGTSSKINVVRRRDLATNSYLIEDWVLFETASPTLYVGFSDPMDPKRVRYAERISNLETISEYQDRYQKMLAFRSEFSSLTTKRPGSEEPVSASLVPYAPPGDKMSALFLEEDVVTCAEASRAKGLPLSSELKSLIIETSVGRCVVHLPGDKELSLRSIKRKLDVAEAKLADPEELADLGIRPGTVCPVLDPCWSMTHLIDESVLLNNIVTTNNGTLRGYFVFDPKVLLEAQRVTRGDFAL